MTDEVPLETMLRSCQAETVAGRSKPEVEKAGSDLFWRKPYQFYKPRALGAPVARLVSEAAPWCTLRRK